VVGPVRNLDSYDAVSDRGDYANKLCCYLLEAAINQVSKTRPELHVFLWQADV
jgi:hypothetical protein